MGKEIITFGDIKVEKHKSYHYQSPIFLEDVDIDNVLVSNKIFFGGKNYQYFIGCLYDDYEIKQLNIMLPRTNTYVKRYDVYFLVEDEDLLDKYNTISDKVSSGFKKNLIANLYTIKKF